MKRFVTLVAAIGCLAWGQTLHAETQTWFGFTVGVGNAPPPRWAPMRGEPATVTVGRVIVVNDERCDDDAFRADNMWWRMNGGWWYRAPHWNGPWVVVDVRRVPRSVLEVPSERWRHHPHGGPPGQLRREERRERRDRRDERAERAEDREERGHKGHHGHEGHDGDRDR